jgi:hypothetical protein
MNISHTQLDECRANPRSWVQAKAGPSPFFAFGYNQALLHAIHRYHRSNGNAPDATQYLEDTIDRNFKDGARADQIRDWLQAYIRWHERSAVVVADSKFRVKLSLGVLLELRGEMHRLDVLPGGYRALLLGPYPRGWQNQLRMPLLQRAVAMRYGRPIDDVSVGVQHLDGSGLAVNLYSRNEIATAESEFRSLSAVVQGYARNIPGLIT